MHRNNLMRVILAAASALILIGVSVMGWALANKIDKNVIEVKPEEGKTRVVEFESLALLPGEECEYTLILEKADLERYQLKFDFVETEEKTLKRFACVKILANGEVLFDDLLATAFEREDILLPVDFGENRNTELKIVYYLPLDVGNEAKNAEAIFDLQLTVSDE